MSVIYVVEQNRDAQLLNLLKVDLDPTQVVKLHSIRHFNGLPIDARTVTRVSSPTAGASSRLDRASRKISMSELDQLCQRHQ